MLWQIKKILHCHFPDLQARLLSLKDPRKGIEYTIEELVMAAIVLFLLKCDSHNDFNNKRKDKQFCGNHYQMFHLWPPHMDAVNLNRSTSGENFIFDTESLIAATFFCRDWEKYYFCRLINSKGGYFL